MKGPYRNQVIEACKNEYPCRWCEKTDTCTNKKTCAIYNSMNYFYQKIGKTAGLELLFKMQKTKTKSQCLDLLSQYNKY